MRKITPYRYGRIERDDVNQLAVENYFRLIEEAEHFYEEQLDAVAEAMESREGLQILCLAGPSSSGKTTTYNENLFVSKKFSVTCGTVSYTSTFVFLLSLKANHSWMCTSGN